MRLNIIVISSLLALSGCETDQEQLMKAMEKQICSTIHKDWRAGIPLDDLVDAHNQCRRLPEVNGCDTVQEQMQDIAITLSSCRADPRSALCQAVVHVIGKHPIVSILPKADAPQLPDTPFYWNLPTAALEAQAGNFEYREEAASWWWRLRSIAYQRGEEDALRSDPSAYESKIREQLMQLAGEQVRKQPIPQGISREPRRLKLHTDPITAPKEDDGVAVWLRSDLDGTQAKEVLADAARAGLNSSIVFGHVALPKKDELVRAIISREAAERTLGHFGEPQTPEGQEARNALLKQKNDADGRVNDLLKEALSQAQVIQGGGQVVEEGTSLDDRLKKAGSDGAARLYHKFNQADASGWDKAFNAAEKGLVDALGSVGHAGTAESHQAAQAILTRIGSGALNGGKIRTEFMGAPYGWSQDAVDALLAVLFACGQLRATSASGSPWPAGKFNRRDVASSAFSRENAPLSNEEKRAIARLVKCRPDESETRAPEFVAKLKDALVRATGAAPRPEAKPNGLIDELTSISGRDLVKRLAEEETAASELFNALDAQASKITKREPGWKQLGELIGHLASLPEHNIIAAERDAILHGRLLLDDPDKIEPLVNRAADSLRAALNTAYAAYHGESVACTKELESAAEWLKLTPEDRAAILREAQLSAPEPTPKVGTLIELVESLNKCSPQRWSERRDALRSQLGRALTLLAQKLEPEVQSVSMPHRIVRSEADLDVWLTEVKKTVLDKLSKGPVQI
jgi:hypothetical protein